MDAPLKPTGPDYYGEKDLDHYSISFSLKDGASVDRDYRMDTGRLSKEPPSGLKTRASGIVAPQAFQEAIKEGVDKEFLKQMEALKAEKQTQKRSCADTRTSQAARGINLMGVPFTTNDVPGGPWGGVLRGTDEDDELAGENGEDEVYGLGGDDTVEGGACDDKLYGGPGRDDMVGDGGTSDDDIDPSSGKDTLYGGPGDDDLSGSLGKDILYGGEGNDTLSPEDDGQRDELYCGKGKDVAEIPYYADKIDYVDDSCEEEEGMSSPVP